MTVTVSARGQMVIPVSIRKRYNIKPHSNVELLDLGSEVVIVPVSGASIAGSKGILKGVYSYDLIKERRKLRKKEHS